MSTEVDPVDVTAAGSGSQPEITPETETRSQPSPEAETETSGETRDGAGHSPEGREKIKWNSLLHGFRSKSLFPKEMKESIDEWTVILNEEFRPVTSYESKLVGAMSMARAKLEHAQALSVVDLKRGIDSAELSWDSDRRARTEELGARLATDVARVAAALNQTKQGIDWLLERWECLGRVAECNHGWDQSQRSLAFDMLGVPVELRNGNFEVPAETDAPALAALVERELGRLRGLQASRLMARDETERQMAAAGMPMHEDKVTGNLRRYTTAARRELTLSQTEFFRVRTARLSGGEPAPAPAPAPAPERPPVSASSSESEPTANLAQTVRSASPEDAPADPIETPAPVVAAAETPAVAEEPVAAAAETPAAAKELVAAAVESHNQVPPPPPPARGPSSGSKSMVPAPPQGNRRHRRAAEKRARDDARRKAKP